MASVYNQSKNIKMLGILVIFFILMNWMGCSGGDSRNDSNLQSGSIALSLQIQDENVSRLHRQAQVSEIDCEARQIDTIEAFVYNALDEQIAWGGPWECEAGEGTINDVEPGIGISIKVIAKNELGEILFEGTEEDIIVLAGETTQAGPVILRPVVDLPPEFDLIRDIRMGNTPRPNITIEPETEVVEFIIGENEEIDFSLHATDFNEGDELAFEVLPSEGRLIGNFDPAAGRFSWRPSFEDQGTYEIVFLVSDSSNLTDNITVKILVLEETQVPVFERITNIRISGEPQEDIFIPGADLPIIFKLFENELIEFEVSAMDLDGDELEYELADPNNSLVNFFNAQTRTFSWRPGFNDAATYSLTIRVTDTDNLQNLLPINIIVEEGNPAPRFVSLNHIFIGDQAIDSVLLDEDDEVVEFGIEENERIEFTLFAEDPEGETIIYQAGESNPLGEFFNTQIGTFSWLPGFDSASVYELPFEVVDSAGLSDFLLVRLTVVQVNQPPQFDLMENIESGGSPEAPIAIEPEQETISLTVGENQLVGFNLIAVDPAPDDVLTYAVAEEWSPYFNPVDQRFEWNALLSNPNSCLNETVQISFMVSDDGEPVLSDNVDVLIQVINQNDPPVLAPIGNKIVELPVEGTGNISFTLSANDPNGDSLSFSASPNSEVFSAGAVFNDSTGVFSWTGINSDDVGSYNVTFSVSDGCSSDSETIQIVVQPIEPILPVVSLSASPLSFSENSGFSDITISLSNTTDSEVIVFLSYTGDAIPSPSVGADYLGNEFSVTIPTGELSSFVTLTGLDDSVFEGNENIIVSVSEVTNATVNTGFDSVTLTLLDDETQPVVSLLDVTSPFMNEFNGFFDVIVSMDIESAEDVTVVFNYGGSATAGQDYSGNVSTVIIPSGNTSASLTLTSIDDEIFEDDEDIAISISDVINGTIDPEFNTLSLILLDDDLQPEVSVSVSPSSIDEGGGVAQVTVSLSNLSVQDVTVGFTYGGTAAPGSDYIGNVASIVIPSLDSSATFTLNTIDDVLFESDEDVIISISSVTNGSANPDFSSSALTIVDNDLG